MSSLEIVAGAYTFGQALMFCAMGAAAMGFGFAWLFYVKKVEDIKIYFWQLFNYFQTIVQTLAIIILFAGTLGPWGIFYTDFVKFHSGNVCIPQNTTMVIYPDGVMHGGIMYENGNGTVMGKPNMSNILTGANISQDVKIWAGEK